MKPKKGIGRLITINRHRIATDGQGVTTLVAMHGCPLKCKFCINYKWLRGHHRYELTPQQLYDAVKVDELYFLGTGGGLTFGGGEPMIQSEFIKGVMECGAKEWHTTIETSLQCKKERIESLKDYVDEWIVDIKDMNPKIYEKYTSCDNALTINNLKAMINEMNIPSDKITCRIPLIPYYNTEENQEKSIEILKSIGITRFDKFNYIRDNE